MKVLVIGSGGREHALAWKLQQSPRVSQVIVSPGNGGTLRDSALQTRPAHTPTQWADLAEQAGVALTVVGPEAPLAEGVVDVFRARGLRIFGPTQAAAQLESSKAYAKAFMQRHGIPTAAYATFTDAASACEYVRAQGAPIVIKADGLAAGKGVVVAQTLPEALAAVETIFEGASPTAEGARVVIEQCLVGEEASFMVVCDGHRVLPLATSQDHKRLLDGDQGPNTGGMGAYSPAPVVTPDVHARVMREIILPTVRGMAQEGHPFTGFLYAGLMIDAQGRPATIEFNARLGDPETQPILMRLRSDLFEVLWAASGGQLDDNASLVWDRRVALGVVMAAAGYPTQPQKGAVLRGDFERGGHETTDPVQVFHAGTAWQDGQMTVQGGRVLCVTALGDSVKEAHNRAMNRLAHIEFPGVQYRRDIGHRALQ